MRATILFLLTCFSAIAQKEVTLPSRIEKVTLFFQGAQIEHKKSTELKPGRQFLVFEKLTDFMDPNSVQVKATGDLTILSVSTRKNFEDLKMTHSEITELNNKRTVLEIQDRTLRDEYAVLQNSKDLILRNSDLKGSETGLRILDLKDAYTFIHTKMTEIMNRQANLERMLETLNKEINKIDQEIITRQNKPVTNYTEILVEIDVPKNTSAAFTFNYISPRASWSPYYDMRSGGIGKPVKLEAKALVNQTTGIEWKDIDLVLSTNDPYENSKEPDLREWYLNYNNYPAQKNHAGRQIPTFDYSGQKLRGEVMDGSTGEPLPFASVSFSSHPHVKAVTDFDGKFEILVPKGASYLTASYIGFDSKQLQITGPYLKFFIQPNTMALEEVTVQSYKYTNSASQSISRAPSISMTKEMRSQKRSKDKLYEEQSQAAIRADQDMARNVATAVVQKDLRVEYTIQSKFTIASNGQDQRVNIADYQLSASYEYHAAPKMDPSVYLVAQVSGWEKLNLLNGESNLYFDGTYIGKTYIDVNSTKDTLSFSLGKDNKIQVERTKISEKTRSKTIGSRQKVDIAWEIKMKNNGGASIPILVKDQFPISSNADIKVKRGEFPEGKTTENSGIITWSFLLGQGQSKVLTFDYSVDYQKGSVLYLE